MRAIQPSLRDFVTFGLLPGVETPGYYHEVRDTFGGKLPQRYSPPSRCPAQKLWAMLSSEGERLPARRALQLGEVPAGRLRGDSNFKYLWLAFGTCEGSRIIPGKEECAD
jgi:hypothetical protein